jgi:hypothetical protein
VAVDEGASVPRDGRVARKGADDGIVHLQPLGPREGRGEGPEVAEEVAVLGVDVVVRASLGDACDVEHVPRRQAFLRARPRHIFSGVCTPCGSSFAP